MPHDRIIGRFVLVNSSNKGKVVKSSEPTLIADIPISSKSSKSEEF